MYEAFYGLTERPFNLTPDPKYLFLSEKHKEAFAHLLFGIKNRSGFVMVTGEIGTGKTTICRTLLNQLDEETEVAFIFNPYLSPEELLRKINEDFGIESKADSVRGLIDELNHYLLDRASKGKNCVLVIDEAQNLAPKVLEQIRLLSNLETETQKLIQIVLIGQPELGHHLELDELRQLNQRITARYHLTPLDPQETLQYIAYRLRVAGGRRKVRFTSGAVRTVYKLSFGVPRVINAICDRALLIGYTMEQADITPAIIRKASKEIRGEHFRSKAKEFWKGLLPSKTFVGAAALIILAGFVLVNPSGERLLDILEQALAKPAESTSAPVNNTVAAAIPDTTTPPAALTTTTPPAPEETIPEIKTFADSLALADPSEMRNTALGALMQAWNLALLGGFPEGDEPKQIESFAKQNGLVFEPVKPTLDQLAAINLPALVQLNANGKPMWAGLLGIEGDQFRIATSPGQTAMVPKAELEPLYAKQAIILWVDPTPTESILKRSMRGGNVEALQAHLQTIGLLGNSPNGVYDDATAEAVRKLQAQCGLSVDGVAGRQTRMVLSSWLPLSDGPQLMEGPVLAAQVTAPAPASPPPVPVVDGPVVLDTPAPEKAATPQEPAPSVDTPVVPDAAPAAKTEPAPEPKVDAPVAPETEAKPAEEVKPVEEAKPENAEPPTTDAPAPEAPAPAPEAPKGVDTPPADEAPAVEVQDLPEPGATPPAPVDESGNDGSRGGPLTVKVDPPAAPIAEGDAADSTTGEGAPR